MEEVAEVKIICLTGTVPPELWNRLGTKVIPKLRSGKDLNIEVQFSTEVDAAAYTEKLIQAILTKAFSGELVPTEAELAHREGRSYESASALLAKIKAQRKDIKPQRKHKRSKEMEN